MVANGEAVVILFKKYGLLSLLNFQLQLHIVGVHLPMITDS